MNAYLLVTHVLFPKYNSSFFLGWFIDQQRSRLVIVHPFHFTPH